MPSQLERKHRFVDATLTRAEREAPFVLSDHDGEPIDGPTRIYCEIEDTGDAVIFADRDPKNGDVIEVGVLR